MTLTDAPRADYKSILSALPAGFKFVDAHHHFWDLSRPGYSWLKENRDMEKYLGPYDSICNTNFLSNDLKTEANKVNLIKSVHIETQDVADPVEETAWLQKMSDNDPDGFPHAIIGAMDLCKPNFDEMLDRHCKFNNFRGIRALIFRDPSFSYSDAFITGLKGLAHRGLILETDADWQHMPMYGSFAKSLPDLKIVLNHCGFPKYRTDAYFQAWKSAIGEFSKNENVFCKISGLGMTDHNWTLESIRPWVDTCLEAFGPQRCMFATNWPVDSLFSSYEELVRSYFHLVRDLSVQEHDQLFKSNAERIYEI